jgi:hypothetical protein
MTDTTKNRIDVTRPLELSDGTPVTFVRIDEDGDIVVEYPGKNMGFYLPDTGEHYTDSCEPRLRNVAEIPTALEKPTFDPTKPVQTRDGRKARIVCTDRAGSDYPIIALIMENNDIEICYIYAINGHFWGNESGHRLDLINVPERIERYRTFCFDGHDLRLGPIAKETYQVARQLAADVDGVIKTITEDGKLISIEVVREDEA